MAYAPNTMLSQCYISHVTVKKCMKNLSGREEENFFNGFINLRVRTNLFEEILGPFLTIISNQMILPGPCKQ